MKTFTGFLKSAGIICLLLTAHIGRTQSWEWARDLYFSYNYGYYDAWYPLPKAIDYDQNGNTYITGSVILFVNSIEKYFLFLAKFDPQGNLVWKKMYGGSPGAPSSGGNALVTDPSGNFYVAGYFSGTINFGSAPLQSTGATDLFVAKFDAQGTVQWARKAGGSGSDVGNGITLDAQGNILVTGRINGLVNFGNISSNSSSDDFFLAKYDAMGTPLWVKRASTSTGWSRGSGISYDNTGNIWVLGSFNDNITLDNVTLTATSNLSDLFVAKFAAAGNLLWAKRISGSNSVVAGGISTDLSGNAVVTGTFTYDIIIGNNVLHTPAPYHYDDAFVAKFGPVGNVLWARQMGIANTYARSRSISTDAAGNCYITGDLIPQNSSEQELFVRQYDVNGFIVWTKVNPGASTSGYAVSTDSAGNCYVAGHLYGNTVYFDGYTLHNNQYISRGVVAKIPADNYSFLEFDEAFICFPCFPKQPVLDYEYRFWSARVDMKGAIYRKVSDQENRDEILWKEDRLEIKLHDELAAGTYYFQLRAILENGTITDWTEALAFEMKGSTKAAVIYPNPVKNQLTIDYQAKVQESLLLTVYDRNGKILLRESKKVQEGKNILELEIPAINQAANPLSIQLQSRLQGTTAWQLIKE